MAKTRKSLVFQRKAAFGERLKKHSLRRKDSKVGHARVPLAGIQIRNLLKQLDARHERAGMTETRGRGQRLGFK